MSQRVKINTEMKEKRFITEALEELGMSFSEKKNSIVVNDGSSYETTKIEQEGENWTLSGESYKVNQVKDKIMQTYAKLVTLDEMRLSGHTVLSEEVLSDGTIKIVASCVAA